MTQSYRTNQRKIIFEFLRAGKDRHFTADEVFHALRERGHEIGKATVYRYLDKLTNEGTLCRLARADGGAAAYEYSGLRGKHSHLKCDTCGELLHLECPDISRLYRHINKKHNFKIDPARMVFHGNCCKCGEDVERKDKQ